MKWYPFRLTFVFLNIGYCSVSGWAVDAENVFKSFAPSVVMIGDVEGFNSGVVLNADGLILTCFHAVDTPLKKKVIADVQQMGKRQRQEFTDVKLIGVHPIRD